jgi:hypothetical protein
MQVAISVVVAAVMWMIENPERGVPARGLAARLILGIAKPYLGKFISTPRTGRRCRATPTHFAGYRSGRSTQGSLAVQELPGTGSETEKGLLRLMVKPAQLQEAGQKLARNTARRCSWSTTTCCGRTTKFKQQLPRVQAYYAVKANSDPAIVARCIKAGASFDVASMPSSWLVHENIKTMPARSGRTGSGTRSSTPIRSSRSET